MSDETPPTKIDTGSVARCRFPSLTKPVVEVMAAAGFAAMEEADGGAAPTAWGNVTEGVREAWRFIAKRIYGAMAVQAGARAEGISHEPKDG